MTAVASGWINRLIGRFLVSPGPVPGWVKSEREQRQLPYPIEVYNGSERVAWFPEGTLPDEVVRDIRTHYHIDPRYRGLDLAVWRNGYLVAIVRQNHDNEPDILRFPFEW